MARDVVMVNGLPGSGKSTRAPRLANALGAPRPRDLARAAGRVRAALWA